MKKIILLFFPVLCLLFIHNLSFAECSITCKNGEILSYGGTPAKSMSEFVNKIQKFGYSVVNHVGKKVEIKANDPEYKCDLVTFNIVANQQRKYAIKYNGKQGYMCNPTAINKKPENEKAGCAFIVENLKPCLKEATTQAK